MVEGEAEDIDEGTFCEAVIMGLESVCTVMWCNSCYGYMTGTTNAIGH